MSEPALRRGEHEPSHYRRAKLFMLLDRCEGDLHSTLEPDIEAPGNTVIGEAPRW